MTSVYTLHKVKKQVKSLLVYCKRGNIKTESLIDYLSMIDEELNTIKTGVSTNDCND